MPMIGPFSGWVTDHDIGTSGAGRVELDVPGSGDGLFAGSDRVRLYVPEEGSWHRLGNGFLTGHGMGPGGRVACGHSAIFGILPTKGSVGVAAVGPWKGRRWLRGHPLSLGKERRK